MDIAEEDLEDIARRYGAEVLRYPIPRELTTDIWGS